MGDESLRKNGTPMVVPNNPDFCKTPVGSATPPLPYFPIGYFTNSEGIAKTVLFTGNEVFTTNSHIPAVIGNEPGVLGGVKSGVNCGTCVAKTYSSTFRVEGGWVVRHNSVFEMNCPNPKGGGNLMGKAIYIKISAMAYIGENGEIKAFDYKEEQVDSDGNTTTNAFQQINASEQELHAMAEQLPDEAWDNPLDQGLIGGPEGGNINLEGMNQNPEFASSSFDGDLSTDADYQDALADQAAAQADLDAANAEISALNEEAILDGTQAALAVTGLIDPTPASDGINAGISWSRGNYGEAIFDGISAFPYVGDVIGKPFKGILAGRRAVKLAKALAKAKKAAVAARKKLDEAAKKAKEALERLKKKKKSEAPDPKSKKSKDKVKGKGRCTLQPYGINTCAPKTGHHLVADRAFKYKKKRIPGSISHGKGLVLCANGKSPKWKGPGPPNEHGKLHKRYDKLDRIAGLAGDPVGTTELYKLEAAAGATAKLLGCNPLKITAQLRAYHQANGMGPNFKVSADPGGKMIVDMSKLGSSDSPGMGGL